MIEYLRELLLDIHDACEVGRNHSVLMKRLPAVVRELERLDARDFAPIARAAFVTGLAELRWAAGKAESDSRVGDVRLLRKETQTLVECLNEYGGEGARGVTRGFQFINDAEMRRLIERDYRELAIRLLPSGAWKSAVVMCGSILEAILFDVLLATEDLRSRALTTKYAPKPKQAWTLHALIQTANELGLLSAQRVATFDQILRDYRNFVHPDKELRAKHPCGEPEALMAKGALDAVCNELQGAG